MKLYIKTFEIKAGMMVALADQDLLGKKLKFKDTKFFVNPRFYEGELVDKEKAISVLKSAVSVNLVGKSAVACGKEAGVISDENVLMINKKVPHAHGIFIPDR